ncbi:hypothetical protein [Phreatobacter stygius]|uniref:Uncharacterized protein n=1 Tax=Phreatobacter stygius TaxID=1940610 RepID=A0A4D7BDT9_9HYPH|nr:hypothetical protein [Phreatobacter stygius]QCI68138.1 hypothetical protein E8M01_30250 [Phreatobacter stygius]
MNVGSCRCRGDRFKIEPDPLFPIDIKHNLFVGWLLMTRSFAYCAAGTCTDVVSVDAYRDISAPVGALENRGASLRGNLKPDVLIVQQLLNKIAMAEGGPTSAGSSGRLQEDGLCGPRTRLAIQKFQEKQFPGKRPDTIVDKAQRTIYRLNQLAAPEVDDFLKAKAVASLGIVASYLVRTLARIDLVRLSWMTPNAQFNNTKEEARLNFHFHLDRSSDKRRDLDMIRRTYQTMLAASGYVPKGPNQKSAFGFLDTRPKEALGEVQYAWAYAGGFLYLQGVDGHSALHETNLRADQIYLSRSLLNAHEGAIIYAITHELAHFCGGVHGDIDYIEDRAYFHKDRKKCEKLDAYQAMTNADSYGQYNWEVNRNTHYQP